MESESLFPVFLQVRVPASMPAAVRQAGRLNHQSMSEWVRRVLLRELVAEGVIIEQRERSRASREGI